MQAFGRTLLLAFAATSVAWLARAQEREQTLFYHENGLKLRWHLQFGLNAVSERNLYWNLAATAAPQSNFNSDTDWLESYIKPGLSFERILDRGSLLYGRLSAVGSYTAGTDAFDWSNTGRITPEEGYLAYRAGTPNTTGFDLSLGARELKLGSGMLIANGGASGFERGALKLGPRKAWKRAAFAHVYESGVTATPFYIEPNELRSNDGHNKLAGADVRYDGPAEGYLGLSYINVLTSDSPYVKAARGGVGPPTILPGGRDGTSALNLYAKTNRFSGILKDWFLTADVAYEWNKRIDMAAWGGRVQVGYNVGGLPWRTVITYSYQAFSGDNPNTARLERFDPLYYEGSPGAWATGSKSSLVFINSNLRAHEVAVRVQPTERDTVTLRYAYISADQLGSPIQFGQATRLLDFGGASYLISGVASPHLADDVFLEYGRVLSPNAFLTAGASISIPGKGIREVAEGKKPDWVGGFVSLVVNY